MYRGKSVEQLGTNGRWCNYNAGTRKWFKRQAAKLMRRMSRDLGDDAPKRIPFRGYTD